MNIRYKREIIIATLITILLITSWHTNSYRICGSDYMVDTKTGYLRERCYLFYLKISDYVYPSAVSECAGINNSGVIENSSTWKLIRSYSWLSGSHTHHEYSQISRLWHLAELLLKCKEISSDNRKKIAFEIIELLRSGKLAELRLKIEGELERVFNDSSKKNAEI